MPGAISTALKSMDIETIAQTPQKDILGFRSEGGRTALHEMMAIAASQGPEYWSDTEKMLESVDSVTMEQLVDVSDASGMRCLHMAASQGFDYAVALFSAVTSDIDIKTDHGKGVSALVLASQHARPTSVAILLLFGSKDVPLAIRQVGSGLRQADPQAVAQIKDHFDKIPLGAARIADPEAKRLYSYARGVHRRSLKPSQSYQPITTDDEPGPPSRGAAAPQKTGFSALGHDDLRKIVGVSGEDSHGLQQKTVGAIAPQRRRGRGRVSVPRPVVDPLPPPKPVVPVVPPSTGDAIIGPGSSSSSGSESSGESSGESSSGDEVDGDEVDGVQDDDDTTTVKHGDPTRSGTSKGIRDPVLPVPKPGKGKSAREDAEEAARKAAEAARKASEEAEREAEREATRKAKEEAARKAEEEAARKAKEEAARKAEEEAARKAEEEAARKAKEEAARKAEEDASTDPTFGIRPTPGGSIVPPVTIIPPPEEPTPPKEPSRPPRDPPHVGPEPTDPAAPIPVDHMKPRARRKSTTSVADVVSQVVMMQRLQKLYKKINVVSADTPSPHPPPSHSLPVSAPDCIEPEPDSAPLDPVEEIRRETIAILKTQMTSPQDARILPRMLNWIEKTAYFHFLCALIKKEPIPMMTQEEVKSTIIEEEDFDSGKRLCNAALLSSFMMKIQPPAAPIPSEKERFQILNTIHENKGVRLEKAFDSEIKGMVVLKTYPPEQKVLYENELFFYQRLGRGAESERVSPQLYSCHDGDKGSFVMVLEHCQTDLHHYVTMLHDPVEKRACVIAIAKLIHQMHRRGIIHGDLKPENIVLQGRRWLLIDFEGARVLSRSSNSPKASLCCATPRYAAPELAYAMKHSEKLEGRHPCTEQTDWWAFGCIIAFIYREGRSLGDEMSDSEMTKVLLKARKRESKKDESPFAVKIHSAVYDLQKKENAKKGKAPPPHRPHALANVSGLDAADRACNNLLSRYFLIIEPDFRATFHHFERSSYCTGAKVTTVMVLETPQEKKQRELLEALSAQITGLSALVDSRANQLMAHVTDTGRHTEEVIRKDLQVLAKNQELLLKHHENLEKKLELAGARQLRELAKVLQVVNVNQRMGLKVMDQTEAIMSEVRRTAGLAGKGAARTEDVALMMVRAGLTSSLSLAELADDGESWEVVLVENTNSKVFEKMMTQVVTVAADFMGEELETSEEEGGDPSKPVFLFRGNRRRLIKMQVNIDPKYADIFVIKGIEAPRMRIVASSKPVDGVNIMRQKIDSKASEMDVGNSDLQPVGPALDEPGGIGWKRLKIPNQDKKVEIHETAQSSFAEWSGEMDCGVMLPEPEPVKRSVKDKLMFRGKPECPTVVVAFEAEARVTFPQNPDAADVMVPVRAVVPARVHEHNGLALKRKMETAKHKIDDLMSNPHFQTAIFVATVAAKCGKFLLTGTM